VPARLLKLGFL
jgi:hypothetical protein